MKAMKSLLAVSVLAAAGAANATTWDVTMDAHNFFAGLGGTLNFVGQTGSADPLHFVGTYDDVTGAGSWTGRAYSSGAGSTALDVNFNQTFVMSTTATTVSGYPHQGTLNPFNVPTCHDNLTGQNGAASSACNGFSGPLSGDLFNTVGSAYDVPVSFTPADGANLTWTLQVYLVDPAHPKAPPIFTPTPMQVTLHAQGTPTVPVPAAAWLFGSGLLGLAGTARRRRNA